MSEKKKLRTPEDIRRELKRKGMPIAVLARKYGLSARTVYDVLAGSNRGSYGEAHKAAVILGLKEGEIEQREAV